jgi:glutamate/tyrosine decarboxylase-like PLP-dependent enzyme
MIDDMIDHLMTLRDRPVWQPMPDAIRDNFSAPLPRIATPPEALYDTFARTIHPYVSGNTSPRFFGWVQGGGNAVSMLAELLAGAMNENCGGRDHVGIALERQVIAWAAEMLGMPAGASGVLLTGSSMANFCAVLCARFAALGPPARADGVGGRRLTAYASEGVHRCVPGALDMAGLGAEALRRIPVDENFRMDLAALRAAIAQDRAEGAQPFMIVGTAGSVDVGAFDDLAALAKIAGGEKIWFHVDGAFGALAALSPGYDALVKGMGDADSIAFDFHKWAQVTYDAGCLLVRDAALHGATFAQTVPYLAAAPRGLAGGQPWPCDLGPDLSRGFRALKIWMTLSAYGTDALAGIVETSCALAKHLAARVNASPQLQLCAPTALNIVCFRATDHSDAQTRDLVADLQEEGLFAPSTTRIGGHSAIRVAIVNHRTTRADIDALLDEILRRI